MILLLALLFRRFLTTKLVEAVRRQARVTAQRLRPTATGYENRLELTARWRTDERP
jgi:hypothetical protein